MKDFFLWFLTIAAILVAPHLDERSALKYAAFSLLLGIIFGVIEIALA